MDGNYGIALDLAYDDNSAIQRLFLPFDPTLNKRWQHQCMVIHTDDTAAHLHHPPKRRLSSLSTFVIFRTPHRGRVFFDDINVWPTTGIPSFPFVVPEPAHQGQNISCTHVYTMPSYFNTSLRSSLFFFKAANYFVSVRCCPSLLYVYISNQKSN